MTAVHRILRPAAGHIRAAVVFAASGAYLNYVFRFTRETFWTAGIGDWMDPYFINALLEHWYRVVLTLGNPASPPMFFPAGGTLGYSHGLVLYAPFYVPIRMVAHPFVASNVTLLLVIWAGTLCLYVLLRKLGLSFVEACVLTAFFATSQNVMNGTTAVWSQRASVFLIPPILLFLLASWRIRTTRRGIVLAWWSGLLAVLLYVQDFYTAHLTLLVALMLGVVVMVERRRPIAERAIRLATGIVGLDRRALAALILAAVAAAWAGFVLLYGGFGTEVFGVRISSRAWERPLILAGALFLICLRLRAGSFGRIWLEIGSVWGTALAAGAAAGAIAFLWTYADAYSEHRSFPEEHLMNALVRRDPALWKGPMDALHDLAAYETVRPFTLVIAAMILAWVPRVRLDRRTRYLAVWFAAVSLIVLIAPLSVGGFSPWRRFFEWLPGFAAIRDPKRIIYPFELAVALGLGLLLARVPARSAFRLIVPVLAFVLMLTSWNRHTFAMSRATALYDRWVAAPIRIDPACRSFFITAAGEEYVLRSTHMWTLYGVDAVFVALNRSIPTLNGYSAWWPGGWDLFNPHDSDYEARVRTWIERHRLTNVCALDIEARTMTPF